MQKVDRLGWAAGFSFRAYGLLIGVRASDEAALGDLRGRLPYGSVPSAEASVDYLYSIRVGGEGRREGTRRFHLLYADAVQLGRTMDWQQLLDGFEKDVELFVGERAHGKVFVHAGVVGWKGRAIVLPGRSLAGKSTLVAELVRAGCDYYSDEFAILDESGRVHPFQRPLELRAGQDPGAGKRLLEGLRLPTTSPPLPVAVVLFSRYRASAAFRPRPISPGRACLEMLRHTLSARTQPELVFPVFRAVTQRACAWETSRGQAAKVVQAILDLADGVPGTEVEKT